MTVSTTTNRVSYSGDGETKTFTYPFKIFEDSDLTVILRDSAGNETTLQLNVDYTVSGAGNESGGEITLTEAPASGETLVIIRELPLTQEIDYLENDPFPAETHERGLDKLTMITQQLHEQLGRALKLKKSSSLSEIELPEGEGQYLKWNDDGSALELAEDLGTTLGYTSSDAKKLIRIKDEANGLTPSSLKEEDVATKDYVSNNYATKDHTHTEADITDLEHDAVKLQGVPIASTSPSDDQVLRYNGSTSQWEPSTISSGDEKVKADSADPSAGYLDAKVDNSTIEVDTGSHVLRVKDAGITQAKLKTSIGSVSVSVSGLTDLTLPGGEYGFYPQIQGDGYGHWVYWGRSYSGDDYWAARKDNTGYETRIALAASSGDTGYARQRYVTSSGEVFWIFLLRDKETGKIISAYQAPDHPCFGNGNDPVLTPHPFGSYDPERHEIIVVNPTPEQLKEMKALCRPQQIGQPKRDLLELFHGWREGGKDTGPLYEPDDAVELEYPKKEITVGIVEDEDDKPLWLKEEARIIKVDISKYQPDCVKVRPLKRVNYTILEGIK